MFVKREVPAYEYIQYLKSCGVSYVTAGLNNMPLQESIRNIEHFRENREIRVLVLTIRFSAGFDLNTASHLYVMDYDLCSAVIEQCGGRCKRIGQTNSEVVIVTFLYRNTFDHFLHEFNHIGMMNPTKSNLVLLSYFMLRNDSTSYFSSIRTLSERFPESKVIATTNFIRIAHYEVRLSDALIRKTGSTYYRGHIRNWLHRNPY